MKRNASKKGVPKRSVLDPYSATKLDYFILNLELQRVEKGWSQKFLAERANITVKTLKRLEKGDYSLSPSVLVYVMCALSDEFEDQGLKSGYQDVIDRFVVGDELIAKRRAAFARRKNPVI